MNILPKKSWHVRTKKNIERVKRDEAEAERLARIEQDRVLHVEQEARIRELRARSGIAETIESKHINLFEGSSDQQQSSSKEEADEKLREQTQWQQKLGIINKLGRSEDANQPWYCSTAPKMDLKVKIFTKPKPLPAPTKPTYDSFAAKREAERILNMKYASREVDDKSKSAVVLTVDSDSSPEIVEIVKGKRDRTKKKSKKKHKKSKKSHKRHKSSRGHSE